MPSLFHWPRLGLLLALALLLAACSGGQSAMPKVGQPAPDLTVTTLNGDTIKISELRGQVVLLNFWATYCDPCRAEMPAMEKIYKEVAGKGGTIIAVDQKEGGATVSKFVDEFQISFPIALDEKGAAGAAYGVQYMPTSFFLDKEGVVRYMKVGQMEEATIRQYFASLR